MTVGFVVAFWTSFRFMSLCIRSIDTIVSTNTRHPLNTSCSGARSLLLLVVWIAALVVTALFLLLAPAIESGLFRLHKLSSFSLSAFSALRAFLIVGVLFGAIYLTYRVVVGKRVGRLRTAMAALVASLGWIGACWGFALAVPVLWNAAQLYGTLGSVVLFLFWAYVIAWVLLLGGFLLVRPSRPRATSQDG
jgi:membrane protein